MHLYCVRCRHVVMALSRVSEKYATVIPMVRNVTGKAGSSVVAARPSPCHIPRSRLCTFAWPCRASRPQFALIRKACQAYGLEMVEGAGFEADDVIASLALEVCMGTRLGLIVGLDVAITTMDLVILGESHTCNVGMVTTRTVASVSGSSFLTRSRRMEHAPKTRRHAYPCPCRGRKDTKPEELKRLGWCAYCWILHTGNSTLIFFIIAETQIIGMVGIFLYRCVVSCRCCASNGIRHVDTIISGNGTDGIGCRNTTPYRRRLQPAWPT